MIPRAVPLRWLPFALGVVWLAGAGVAGTLRLDLAHALGAGLLGAAWLLGRGLWPTAVLLAALLVPQAWHFAVQLPAAQALLAPPRDYVRVEGTVRAREALRPEPGQSRAGPPAVRLLLGDARLWHRGHPRRLAEVAVRLPARSEWAFRYRSRLRIGGRLRSGAAGMSVAGGRLRLAFAEAGHHVRSEPLGAWGGEALRLHLRDRAAYHLSRPALAVYLPIVLGLRERDTPEARAVAAAFRRVGVAHLFAISGLHVGLLYFFFGGIVHWGSGGLQRGQGWVHAPAARRAAVLAVVWGYIALIGFPLPAVRAALMGTLLVWNETWGTRTPALYVLGLAALVLLAFDPSQLYDVSFQLSFGAYFFLLCALRLYRPVLGRLVEAGWPRLAAMAAEGARVNLWMTLLITLGLWPLVAATFGQVSLLVFAGNLVMVPLLAFAVLPAGLAGLGASLLAVGAPPGGWLERGVFAGLDALLRAWVWIVAQLDAAGGALVLPVTLEWGPRTVFVYYAAVLAGIGWLVHRRRRRPGRPAPAAPAPP